MMAKFWALSVVMALATLSTVRAVCDDLELYFGDVSSVSEISLDVIRIDCPENEDGEMIEEVLIESGKSLTITTTRDYVRFVNVRFTVEDGASLIFDLPKTRFGPNSGDEENAQGFMLDVKEGGSVTFTGKFRGSGVENVRSMFYNAGTMEFKGNALFVTNGNVFRSNSGILKFRGDTVFRNNYYLAIENIDSGYVRFSKTATFEDNAGSFDGGDGCAVRNKDPEGTVIFRDVATFDNHSCDGSGAVSNSGKMRFYGKTYFNDNRSRGDRGGGAKNKNGTLIFKAAVQFSRNSAEQGGGISVEGGEVTFKKSVLFDANEAEETGGAISLTFGGQYGSSPDAPGSLTFAKPDSVRTSNNAINENGFSSQQPAVQCQLASVEEGTTLTGFDRDDVCDAVEP